MSEHPSPPPSATSGRVAFDERLSVPLWSYLVAVGVGVLLGAEIHMGYPGVRSWIGYVVLVPLCVGALYWLGRTQVRVADGVFSVADESVPLALVGRTDTVERRDKQVALGPELDPQAFLMHRAWVGPVVRVEILDPASDVPYWIVSTRHPDRLRAALAAGNPG
ncbi:DUF3093 domain-containing protein [Pseudonocardia sp. D17]|uniref:DUF3093 domain-containing protein n=1 Tax=Pseudonocardia sp. D17 TaxID=882661 RepID=UPI0030CA91AC